jgi:hypothetical protein
MICSGMNNSKKRFLLKKDADKNNNKKSIKHLIPKRIRQISMKNG